MAFPVRVYNPKGKLIKTITTEQLAARFEKALGIEVAGTLSNQPVQEIECAACGKLFWGHDGRTKYCPGSDCARAMKVAQNKASGLRRRKREKARQANQTPA